jgi:hypothetical protein
MAIYHLSAKVISRSSGRSAVAASAYRAGEKLTNERDGLTHDYTHKKEVDHKEILAPDHAPEWVKNREKLWNEVEKIEKQNNSQLAREIEVALPTELDRENQIELLRSYVNDNFVSKGMVADIAIHAKQENPHAHIMLTMRPFEQDGTWGSKAKKEYLLDKNGDKIKTENGNYKSRKIASTDWDKKENLERWRESWASHVNLKLEREGIDQRIDHRSYQEQGLEKIPQVHLGAAHKMEQRGIETELGNKNREIEEKNREIEIIKYEEKDLKTERLIELENKQTPLTFSESRELSIELYLERSTEKQLTELEQNRQDRMDDIREFEEVQNEIIITEPFDEERQYLEREYIELKNKIRESKIRETEINRKIEIERERLLKEESAKREIEKQAKEICRESFYRTATKEQITSKIEETDKLIKKYDCERADLQKNLISEDKAQRFALNVHTKGDTEKLIKERKLLKEEEKNLEDAIKRHQEEPKPKLFDFQGKKNYEQEEKNLEAWKKDFENRKSQNDDKIEATKKLVNAPEAKEEIKKIQSSVLEKDAPNRERVNKLERDLKYLRDERVSLSMRREQINRDHQRSLERAERGNGMDRGFER